MKIEQIGMAAFRQQAESGGVDEFVVQRFGGVYHLFAVNRRAGGSYFLQDAVAIQDVVSLDVPLRSCQGLAFHVLPCVLRITKCTEKMIGAIKAGQAYLGWDDALYRQTLARLTGKTSTTRCNLDELRIIREYMHEQDSRARHPP